MQIDFHHATTYVCARLAGFSAHDAGIVAYAAQYIDDATNDTPVMFDNDAVYARTATAHKMLDYKNTLDLMDRDVWLPFHFLPGNGGLPAGQVPEGTFVDRLICRPDSPVARDAIESCFADRQKPYGLHRLGVMAHVYADTWAHQGFAGIIHLVNQVDDLQGVDPEYVKKTRLQMAAMGETTVQALKSAGKRLWHSIFDQVQSSAVERVLPLGHGAALSCPDRPYLVWSYTNGRGLEIRRDNPLDFLIAADSIYSMFKAYRNAGAKLTVIETLPAADRDTVNRLFRTTINEDGEARHAVWAKAIAEGAFSFGKEAIEYIPKGEGSWKYLAISDDQFEQPPRRFPYKPEFMQSNWKLFHDAVKAHRFSVIVDILPRYGICAR